MIAYLFSGPMTRLQRNLERLANPTNWMQPLLAEWRMMVTEDNHKYLMLGLDVNEKPFIPVKRKHGGPPLLADWHRAINYVSVWGEQTGKDTFTLTISWPAFKSQNGKNILAMHADPSPKVRYPKRDAIGFRPTTTRRIVQHGSNYLGRQMRGLTYDTGYVGAVVAGRL